MVVGMAAAVVVVEWPETLDKHYHFLFSDFIINFSLLTERRVFLEFPVRRVCMCSAKLVYLTMKLPAVVMSPNILP